MKCYKKFKRCHILYRLNILDIADINNFVKHLDNDQFLKFIIIFGNPQDQVKLYAYYRAYVDRKIAIRTNWVFHDLRKDDLKPYLFDPGHRIYSFQAENYKLILQ